MITGSHAHRAGEYVADKYLLLRSVNTFGGNSVWVGHHMALDVHVAIKLTDPAVECTDAAAQLFHEAQSAARARHPAIVNVLDVGRTSSGQAYLAMELLEGETLSEVLRREGRLDPATAVRVLLPIVEAVSTLHRHGIIHGDIRPENIFLSCGEEGTWGAKLIDFAQARNVAEPSKAPAHDDPLWMPPFRSPERLQGLDLGGRDDLWALAVVLYRVITGELPFEGTDAESVRAAQLRDEPRALSDHGIDDQALWAVSRRGLNGAIEQRWLSADEMRAALTAWVEGRDLGQPARGPQQLDAVKRAPADVVDGWWVSTAAAPPPTAMTFRGGGLVAPQRALVAEPVRTPTGLTEGAPRNPRPRSSAGWGVAAVAVTMAVVAIGVATCEGPRAIETAGPAARIDHGAPPPVGATPPVERRRDEPGVFDTMRPSAADDRPRPARAP